ncbi:hypothetical protein B0T19DRAFT_399999 [Cercophora scortea]|uniref:Uncharacterized protein n=1 Tax=Cercophora scortea TaxID=314031 RepID=A0AAE0MCF8_9PEZI|nr:hypothetical protein B0T19DRAFT_399999 [Cercophora scortea]
MSALESPRTSHDPQPRPELPVSYLDYLARLKDSKPCLDWLHQFFQWRPHEPEGQMDVFDVVGGRIQVRSSESITLGDRAADVDFRIVQLSYENQETKDLWIPILAWDDKAYVPTPENNLIHFVLPHVRHLLNNFSQRLERFRLDTASALNPDVPDAWDGNVRKEERIYFGVYTYGERISQCATSLDHFLALHQKKPSTALKNATDDFAILLKEAIELRDALHDQLGRRAAILSLQESRKSIQMADSLKTLTQLAFVFTPLNFAMSIFGANIVEFGSGTAPAWALAVTAVVIGLTTMLTWLVWSKIKGTLKAHASHIRAIFKLAQRSPALGLLLLVVLFTSYGAIKRDDPDDLLFDTLGIAPLIKKPEHEYSELERASLSDFEPPPVGTPFLEAFCQNSLRQIATYTSQEGWQLDRFYKPWIRWRRHAAARRAVLRQGSNESGDRNSV